MKKEFFTLSILTALVSMGCSSNNKESDVTTITTASTVNSPSPVLPPPTPSTPKKVHVIDHSILSSRFLLESPRNPKPDNIGDGSCTIPANYSKLNPIYSSLTPKQVLEKTIELLNTVKSEDDLTRENIRKVMKTTKNTENYRYKKERDSERFSYSITEDIIDDWRYYVSLTTFKEGDQSVTNPLRSRTNILTVGFTNKRNSYFNMEYVCQMDFDQFFSEMVDLGYSYDTRRPLHDGNLMGSYMRDVYTFQKNIDVNNHISINTQYIKYKECRCIDDIYIGIYKNK